MGTETGMIMKAKFGIASLRNKSSAAVADALRSRWTLKSMIVAV
jgi:hypothetical protein